MSGFWVAIGIAIFSEFLYDTLEFESSEVTYTWSGVTINSQEIKEVVIVFFRPIISLGFFGQWNLSTGRGIPENGIDDIET